MKHIVIDPGMLPLSELNSSFESFSKRNKLTLITEKSRKEEFTKTDLSCEILYYDDFKRLDSQKLKRTYGEKFNFVLNNVLNDQRTFLIAERVHKIFAWNSLFSLTSIIEKIVYNSLIYFEDNNVEFILFQATPHNLPNWVIAKVAEAIEIPVRMIQTSPLPWRFWIVEGLDVQEPVFPLDIEISDFDTNLLNEYIRLNQADYSKALPEYEKKRLDSRKGKFWSWRKEIKNMFSHPRFAISLPTKRKLFNLYDTLSVKPDLSRMYLVFFLHFQPERTSMPEGLDFSNQWLIIRMISQAMPEGWKLIVKEHPSMFTNHLDFRYRNSSFYNDIDSLKNVELAKLDSNTFDLIDNAQGVVTITGTVGVQALIRNTAVMVFGVASYREMKNVYTISTIKDLKMFFLENSPYNKEDTSMYIEQFSRINSVSVSGIYREKEFLDNNFYKADYRVNGHISLIHMLLAELN